MEKYAKMFIESEKGWRGTIVVNEKAVDPITRTVKGLKGKVVRVEHNHKIKEGE